MLFVVVVRLVLVEVDDLRLVVVVIVPLAFVALVLLFVVETLLLVPEVFTFVLTDASFAAAPDTRRPVVFVTAP